MAGTVKTEVFNQFGKLPQKAQQEVADFIAFLGSRYKKKTTGKKEKVLKLKEEVDPKGWTAFGLS